MIVRKIIMNNFKRDTRSGGGRRGGGDFRRRDSGPREMHSAVCDECGNDCKVPFKPTGGKPIYCSNCFEKKDGGRPRGSDRGRSRGSGFGGRDNTNKQLLEQVSSLNTKLDRILKVIEPVEKKKPTSKTTKKEKPAKKKTSKISKTKTKKSPKKTASKK